MTRPKRSIRIKKTRMNTADMLASQIMPASQAARKDFELCDVANHTDADQRHMQRSGAKQTLRKLTRIDKLERRGVIDKREAGACTWYATAHAARYDTCGITAKYGDGNGAACTDFDHMPKTRQQWEAWDQLDLARAAIPPMVRPMFDAVVVYGRPLGKMAVTFRMAARRLLEHIEGKVAL